MKFCPKCKSLMYPKDEKVVCNKCGYTEEKKGKSVVVKHQRKEKEVTLIENGENLNVLPKTKKICMK